MQTNLLLILSISSPFMFINLYVSFVIVRVPSAAENMWDKGLVWYVQVVDRVILSIHTQYSPDIH